MRKGLPTEEPEGFPCDFNSPRRIRVLAPTFQTTKKEPPTLPYSGQLPGERGSPFFRCYDVAKRPDTAYKRERGLPLVPNPGPRTQTLSKEWYSLPYHEGSNQRATPFSLALLIRPGPRGCIRPRGRRRLALLLNFYFLIRAEPARRGSVREVGVELASHGARGLIYGACPYRHHDQSSCPPRRGKRRSTNRLWPCCHPWPCRERIHGRAGDAACRTFAPSSSLPLKSAAFSFTPVVFSLDGSTSGVQGEFP